MLEKTEITLDLNRSVGDYLYDCLSKAGITEIFGVPGDYNFSLLNILEKYEAISFVTCRNELNAGYASDAYSRVKGLSALITTFGVGELSACNAIAGAYCESVPVIHIVGGPNTMVQKEHKQMHHTLLDGDFDVFRKVYEHITEYTVILTPDNAVLEIPKAINIAKETKKPVYILVAIDVATMPLIQRDVYIEKRQSSQPSLQAAVQAIDGLIKSAQKPVLISGVHVLRYGLESKVQELVENMNIPVTTMMMGKGSFNESHKNYIGHYAGCIGSLNVQNIVESSDCILAIGTMWSDYNTGSFTAKLNPLTIIEINPYQVKVGMAVYENILMQDILNELLAKIDNKIDFNMDVPSPYVNTYPPLAEDISSQYYYPRFQEMLKENDIIIADAGNFQFGISEMKLKKGVTYITQGGWGSIGYGTPAAFGACIADKNRRVILFVGDGSNQMTVQELSSMLYNHCKPIIFLVNNKEYSIEKYLNIAEKQTHYNDLPLWDYSKIIEAFGGEYYVAKVYTNKELNDAITQAELQCNKKLCFIEIYAPQMDAPNIVHKMTNVLEQMEKQK